MISLSGQPMITLPQNGAYVDSDIDIRILLSIDQKEQKKALIPSMTYCLKSVTQDIFFGSV